MSLINNMLKDLEAREKAVDAPAARAAHEGLHAVHVGQSSSRSPLVLGGLIALLLGAAGVYLYYEWAISPAPVVVARTPAPPVASAPVKQPPLVDVAVSPPQNVVAAAPVATPEPVAKSEPPQSIATPTPEAPPPAPKPTPVAVVTPSPAAPVSAVVKAPPAQIERPAVVAKAKPQPQPQPKTEAIKEARESSGTVEKRTIPVNLQDQAETYYREAAQYVSQGRAQDARVTLIAALTAYPSHIAARELAAAVSMQTGRLREAQDSLAQGLKLSPNHLPFSLLLARVFIEQGADGQAIATLEAAQSAGASNADYYSLLAALYQRTSRYPDAVKAYRETIALRAQDGRAWLGLGISLEAVQDNAGAGEAYTRALQLGNLDVTLTKYAQQRLAIVKR